MENKVWSEYILESLRDLNHKIDSQSKMITDLRIVIERLKTYSSILGFIAGAIPVIGAAIIEYFIRPK